ncbi:hypothetical protein H7R52_16655 [Weissella confusa]|uniref:Uncharacterized protein n=1 Tax=Weissella confusa TaxID=1583 RepID=A0A923SU64_WEICO|nr:hypothetical protein [Weissella confusa]
MMMAIEKGLNASEADNALHFSWDFSGVADSTGAIVLVFLFVNFIGLAVNLGDSWQAGGSQLFTSL